MLALMFRPSHNVSAVTFQKINPAQVSNQVKSVFFLSNVMFDLVFCFV